MKQFKIEYKKVGAITAAAAVVILASAFVINPLLNGRQDDAEEQEAKTLEYQLTEEELAELELPDPEIPAIAVKPVDPPAGAAGTGEDGEDSADASGDAGEQSEEIVQGEVSYTPKPAPPEPPKVEDESLLEDSEEEPTYSEEALNPKTEPEGPQGGDRNGSGQIYVPGFGWVDEPEPAQGNTVGEDGDELTGIKVGIM